MDLRVWRYAASLLMGLGLVVLWGIACRGEIPLVQIQGVHSTMNGDSVRVQGVVSRYPDYDPITERLTFWLDDGTGQMVVVLDWDENPALLDLGRVPTVGDRVTATGRVSLRATKAAGDLISLTVREPERLDVERPSPVESSLADAAVAARYGKVLVQGHVSAVWQPYEGLTVLRLTDGTGEIDVVYDQNLVWISGSPTTVLPGDVVSVRGAVIDQNGQSLIVLDAASGLQRLPALAQQAKNVQVDAVQTNTLYPTEAPRSPTARVTIVPASPTPTVASSGTGATATAPAPTVSAPTVLTPTATATLAPVVGGDSERQSSGAPGVALVQTGVLSTVPLGNRVTVEGRIVQATLLSAGCKSVVDDGSGPAIVWMPNALYDQLVDPEGWNVGGVVRVTGRASEFKGELELVPQAADATVIVQRAPRMAGPDAEIVSLNADELGRRVTVEGTIVTVEPFSAGVKCVLDDGSGRMTLLLWQNVFNALPDQDALVAGARVRVSGWTEEYRGDLEIIPGLAYDVVVLGIP